MTSNDGDSFNHPRERWLLGIAGVLLVSLVIVWWPGCRQYPSVTSREALQQMKLLYAACNTKDLQRLDRVTQGMNRLSQEGKISPDEVKAFQKIIDLAKAGKWNEAEDAAFRFAQDQVGYGHPDPDEHDDHPKPIPKTKPKRS